MAVRIVGLGCALPPDKVSTVDFAEHAKRFSCSNSKQERILEELYRRTTIETRSTVLASAKYGVAGEKILSARKDAADSGPGTQSRMECYASEITPLAVAASRAAIRDARESMDAITHVVTASCTGFFAPGFDVGLIQELPLKPQTSRTHVGFMGCHGSMNAMRVAQSYCESNKDAVVLLCAAELCSLHFQYGWDPDRLVANSLFSDGAAAMVLRARESESARAFRLIGSDSIILPNSAEAMQWKITDNGFRMHLSSTVPALVEQSLPPFVHSFLMKHNLRIADVAGWAVHPGGPRILDAVQSSLSLEESMLSHSRSTLAECGNMSSPTVLFILERMRSTSLSGPIVMLGFGPGLTIEAALLNLESHNNRQKT